MSTTIYFDQYGEPSEVSPREETLPTPAEGEVTIANKAIGVDPVDWMIVAGYLKDAAPLPFPAVPGNESAGVVEAVGPGVTSVSVGDEVIWSGFTGGYREKANVPEASLTKKPHGIDFDLAASLPVAAATAYSAVHQVGVTEGDTVLVHNAAGGVGSAAVQIAKDLGARVIATASASNHDYLRSLGAEPVEYGDGLAERVRALGEITASVDAVGGAASVAATKELLNDLSRAVTATGDENSAEAGIATVVHADNALEAVAALAEKGVLTFSIQERIPLADAAKALEISKGKHVRGKLVLIP
jgi:NADPH:quinone reductase-like Zn-dependent oxidoreductase